MTEKGPTFGLNKIVRGKLPDMMRELGQEPEVTQLQGMEQIRAQIKKIAEEVAELDPTSPKFHNELADLDQAERDLIELCGGDEVIEPLRLADLEKRGGFLAGYFIGNLHLKPGDTWTEYYRRDPGKFPEIGVTNEACVFCEEIVADDNLILASGAWKARWDLYPATPGHVEIVPLRHVRTIEELTDDELRTMMVFAREVMDIIRQTDLVMQYELLLPDTNDSNRPLQETALAAAKSRGGVAPDAFNLGINDGPEAGQSVGHLHLHIMPRWEGDMKNPRGGVRNLFRHDTYKDL